MGLTSAGVLLMFNRGVQNREKFPSISPDGFDNVNVFAVSSGDRASISSAN